MTGRIVLGPSPDAGPPHVCEGMTKPKRDDWSMVGAIWRCDECGQYWHNRRTDLGGLWDKVLADQALEIITEWASAS